MPTHPGPLRRGALAVTATSIAIVALAVPAPPHATAVDDGTVWLDPQVVDAVEDAASATTGVRIEMVTTDTDSARSTIRALGGVVTGTVDGELVQATLPAGRIDDVTTPDSAVVQLPRRVNRLVAEPGRIEFGPTTGENVAVTNAGTWHAAGLRGAVKVGIIDFFDLGLWNPSEHGPRPDGGHLFCRDTSGQAPSYCPMPEDGINDGSGEEHGVAVVEVLKDTAPDAEVYLATVATTADVQAAIDWFASNGVSIVSRSLGAAYDGPGDGTGPLAAVVDHAAELGITWFNSAGNDAGGGYGRFTNGMSADGYVDFDNGPGVDTTLSLFGTCIGLDGIRWSDWNKPASSVTDYRVEMTIPGVGAQSPPQASQTAGAPPLEMVDAYICTLVGQIDIRLRRVAAGLDTAPDTIEIAVFSGRLENGRSQAAFSAAKAVVDSRNPALVAVGAVDPPTSVTVAAYSSQGPTNDGRVKPDLVGPSCLASTIYRPSIFGPGACFNGTSAASPVAAGVAALLLGRSLARSGAPLAALTKHLAVDLAPGGPDFATGLGMTRLPAVPGSVDARPAQYAPLAVPRRILDTRPSSPTPGAPLGPFGPYAIVDLPVAATSSAPVSAVAVSIASVDSTTSSYVQALPTLIGQLGGFANLNVAFAGQIKPNLAIVPVGANGAISLFLPVGGNLIVDLMGTFSPTAGGPVAAGRFVPVDPVRVVDTRPEYGGPTPADPSWTPHRPVGGETVRVGGVPAGASAVVLNITATEAAGPGFLRAQPTGATAATTANGNYVPGVSSGTLSIVPVVPATSSGDGTVSVFTSNSTHIIADLVGYFTDASGPPSTAGLFVPIAPARAYDSRFGPGVHGPDVPRTIPIAAGVPVPATAIAVSANLAADAAESEGFATLYPSGAARPGVSSLNFPATAAISNAAFPRLAGGGAVDVVVNRATHVIIDVNGYFTGPA